MTRSSRRWATRETMGVPRAFVDGHPLDGGERPCGGEKKAWRPLRGRGASCAWLRPRGPLRRLGPACGRRGAGCSARLAGRRRRVAFPGSASGSPWRGRGTPRALGFARPAVLARSRWRLLLLAARSGGSGWRRRWRLWVHGAALLGGGRQARAALLILGLRFLPCRSAAVFVVGLALEFVGPAPQGGVVSEGRRPLLRPRMRAAHCGQTLSQPLGRRGLKQLSRAPRRLRAGGPRVARVSPTGGRAKAQKRCPAAFAEACRPREAGQRRRL